jgi:hypothetical protein
MVFALITQNASSHMARTSSAKIMYPILGTRLKNAKPFLMRGIAAMEIDAISCTEG